MKIIHCVESYTPAVNGMQTVVSQLSERLAARGHEVIVLTSFHPDRTNLNVNGVQIVEFNIHGNLVNGLHGEVARFENFISSEPCDIFVNFAAQQWSTDLSLPVLDSIKAKKVFVPTGFSAFYETRYQDYYRQMQRWIKGYDANVFLSDDYRDINFARAHGAKNIILIPNGADEREFTMEVDADAVKRKYKLEEKSLNVLSVGSHTGLKGHNEAIEVFKRAKLKYSNLIIIGNSPKYTTGFLCRALAKTILAFFFKRIKPDCTFNCHIKRFLFNVNAARLWDKKRIYTWNLNRAETVKIFKISDIFLFPSNIECSPIVLFECIAASLPFLVSDVGNSREIIAWTGAGALVPTTKDERGFSHIDIEKTSIQLTSLATNPNLRAAFAKKGFEAFESTFNWAAITIQYEELYNSLLDKDNSNAS